MINSVKKNKISIAILLVGALTAFGATHIGLKNAQNNQASMLVDQSAQLSAPSSYILQGSNTERVVDAVQNVGGKVADVFPIINAVSAMLTPSQADQLISRHKLRVKSDRSVELSSIPEHLKAKSADGVVDNFISRQTFANQAHSAGITGEGVGVAILDSGMIMTQQNSSLRVNRHTGKLRVTKYNAIAKKIYTGWGADWNGHGTHLASIIADNAQSQNDSYFNGIAPDVDLISVRAFNANGTSSYTHILSGLDWIYNNHEKHNIRVLNLSFGVTPNSMYYDDPINQAVMKLWDAGIVVVVSAGNNGEDFGITVPGNNPYVITVGAATDNVTPYEFNDDRIVSFSAQGPTFEGFIKPDVVSYGGQIAARVWNWRGYFSKFNKPNYANQYIQMSGTSQAAAVTSGIAALVISNNPSLSPDDVKCKIMSSTRRLARDNEGTLYTPLEQGAGLVNAWEALMTNNTGCANQGLDIKAELEGTKHFRGPVYMNNNDELVIDAGNESILIDDFQNADDIASQRNWWETSDTALQRNWWSDTDTALQRSWWGTGSETALQNAWWVNSNADMSKD